MPSLKHRIRRARKRGLQKLTPRLGALGRDLAKYAIAFWHRATGSRPTHLVISGCSRSGTTLLYNMLRSSATGPICMPDTELSARKTYHWRDTRILTKRPLDIFRLAKIDHDLGSCREILHLVLIRDPRDLVSSKHRSVPNQFFQGYDYQFFISNNTKSFTYPGIAAVAEAIDQAEAERRRVFVLRYEDLVQNPEHVRRIISFATGFPLTQPFENFHQTVIPADLSRALNGVRPVEVPSRPAWTVGDRYRRACRQLELFPEMEELAVRWGYPPTNEVRRTYDLPAPQTSCTSGTIVAFHTDDDFYTEEAVRCRARLEQLELPHDFTSVPKNGNWVENCALKPEFLLDVRQRLRGPLLYIDVDAFVHRNPWPYLSSYDADMAAYIHGDSELLSGTLFLNDTPAVLELLSDWVARQKQAPQVWDQKILEEIIRKDGSKEQNFIFQRLPPNFAFICDKDYNLIHDEPIIEHLQASRIAKRGRRGDQMARRIDELKALTVAESRN